MHKLKAQLHPTFALVCALLASACVDEFDGANIQIDFGPFMPPQARTGVGTPGLIFPASSHYRLYGIRATKDGNGTTVSEDYTEIQRFEIHRIVEGTSPCYLDPAETRYPGIHVTRFEARLKEDTGITDITAPRPPGATEQDEIDVATAIQRTRNVTLLGRGPNPMAMPRADPGGLKAVTSVSTALYPTAGTVCIENGGDPSLVPPPECSGNDSNRVRLQLCQAFWSQNPDYYEGTDRVLTEPLAGQYFGIVIGQSPINGAFLGGTQFFVEDPTVGYDGFAIFQQYDDLNGDGTPDPPMGFPAPATQYGNPVVSGAPRSQTRGVTRAVLLGTGNPEAVFAELAIFPDLGGDDVHF